MGTYKVNVEAVKKSDNQASSIYRSGLYNIVIQKVYITTRKQGSKQLNIRYRLEGSNKDNGTLFISMTNNNGSDNFQKVLFDKLITVLDLTEISTEKQTIKTKKDSFEATCFPALENKKVKVWVKFRYNKFKDNIYESIDVQEFFRISDNAVAKEVLTKENIGKRFEACKVATNVTDYRDGLTKEDVDAWLEKRKNESMSGKKESAVITPEVDIDDEIPF